jgi:DNA-binding SARP family transcriptional activator
MESTIARAALVERTRAVRPAILALLAPAGFGKSTLARQLLDGSGPFAICDCRGITSEIDFAHRVVSALAAESPERSGNLAQSDLLIGDGHASDTDRVGVALAAWRVRTVPSAFVFENAEDVIGDPALRELLARFLALRPESRTVVICSRTSLRMHLSRFAPPHQIVTLRAADLAFTRDEITTVFAHTNVPAATLDRIATLSAGWPIAVLLLARFAHEGRLDALLDRLDDVAYEELHEYLADQVLATLDADVRDALLACAALGTAEPRDLRLAAGDAAYNAFTSFAKTSPFVTRGDDGFDVHPLLASTLLDRYPDRVDALLAPAAAAYATAGEFQRAAEIHLARHDPSAAAAALDRVEVAEDAAPQIGYARVLSALDHSIVLRYPRLWAVTALMRTFVSDSAALLEEAEGLAQRLPPDTDPSIRVYLYVFRILFLSYIGEFARALALVDDFRMQIAAPEVPTTRMHAWLLYFRSLMTARLGRLEEAERDFAAAWPFINGMHVMSSGALVTLAADVDRVRGDRDAERDKLNRGLERVRQSGLSNFIAFDEGEAAFGAWFAGEDELCAEHAFLLEAEVNREGIRGFAFFAAALRGHERSPQPADHGRWIACGHLVLASTASDPTDAIRHAELARESARHYHAPFTRVITALALAELDATRRRELRAEAAAVAATIDAPTLHHAVAAIVRGDDGGYLAPFIRRYRRGDGSAKPGITIELVTGRVLRDDVVLGLPEREHALLSAIAMRPDAISRQRLTDMLWPDLGESAARNAFHVCLHRLKARMQNDGIIVHTPDGYRLAGDVRVDLWEIDRMAASLRAGRADEAELERRRTLYERLRATRTNLNETWDWFEPVDRHLRELRCEVAQLLAGDALVNGRIGEALTLANETIAYDPCDEPAREIAIRAYLADGDRAAALRHFRQYRDTLMAELQCEPSHTLAALVGVTVSAN